MIENFEEETKDLTDEEVKYLDVLVKSFKNRTIENPIKAPEIVSGVRAMYPNLKFTEVRLRKFVNHIRSHSILPLVATSKGYFVTNDSEVIKSQVRSLQQRSNSIIAAKKGLEKFII